MPTVKLNTHQRNHYQDDIVICQKDFPDIKIGDVVEIYSIDDNFSRLLLQITNTEKLKANCTSPTISIEQSIAMTFQLRNFSDVIMNVIDKNTVPLDSVELFFKDQYLSRSDMWRLRKHLTNTCVHLNKKVEFSNIRCQVFEMWSQGCRMASGYINDETKIVFRSASSMVYLFLQMSSEMWDYDINGDLYFEKAVKGFLSDLFNKWKTFNCSHDVTIVLFSRTFYQASDINEFPESMRECLQQDYKGRFYEDYYRVAVQNERFDDWTPTLIYLRELFNLYEEDVIHYHERRGFTNVRPYNSTASQGNFLEVLNMSLNVFERHNLDRSFDRTGQLSVVISPGVGVYEVDLDLTNITKQRIIDNGIGSDLVCLGEQPLHAVPLFKFISRHSNIPNDEYNMPHWINLSFYSSKQSISLSSNSFIPRIKMPNIDSNPITISNRRDNSNGSILVNHKSLNESLDRTTTSTNIDLTTCQNIAFIDYDDYDSLQKFCRSKILSDDRTKNQIPDVEENRFKRRLSVLVTSSSKNSSQKLSSNDTIDGFVSYIPKNNSFSLSTSVENKLNNENHIKIKSKDDIVVYNSRDEQHRTKALINPFDPSHVTIKLNSNRRRWTHVFPLGPTGIFMQQHHYQAVPQKKSLLQNDCNAMYDSNEILNGKLKNLNNRTSFDQIDSPVTTQKTINNKNCIGDGNKKLTLNKRQSTSESEKKIENDFHQKQRSQLLTDNSLLWAWGATGEQEWTPAITTGVDWKSLVMPACLPITTDFLPDKRTLQQDYVTYVYDLLPEEQSSYNDQYRFSKSDEKFETKPTILTNDQFYEELIFQRLQQGFQIIFLPKQDNRYAINDRTGNKFTYILSIGRIYHELAHKENKISIIYYHPRHPYKANNIRYCYRIRTPDNSTYGVSWVDFNSEKLETYKWNYLDNYICLKGDYAEYPLTESLKYWRFRLLVLPTQQSKTKKIIDKYLSGEDDFQCDIYDILSFEEKIHLQKGFIKLLKVINGIKLPLLKAQTISQSSNASIKSDSLVRKSLTSSHNRSAATSIRQDSIARIPLLFNKPIEAEYSSSNSPDRFLNDQHLYGPLNQSSSMVEIIELMKKTSSLFTIKFHNLPDYVFVSLEAIEWAVKNIENIPNENVAETIFNNLLLNDYIRHASGNRQQIFKRGFHLYCLMTEQNRIFFEKNEIEFKYFERNWMEVGIVRQNTLKSIEFSSENFSDFSNHCNLQAPEFTFKNFTIDLEQKTDRVEWVNVKYHSLYDPEQAFELLIEWMVATGNAIPDIVATWGRTKGTNLHIVPIPWDPFALPFSSRSDPLRGPIYISLNIDCLQLSKMLEGEKLFNFQEKILVKFGFLPFHDPSTDNQRQFVHVSGSIFVLIPNKTAVSSQKISNKRGKFLKTNEPKLACSPHEEYITRHFSGMQQKDEDAHIDIKIGFLWCWNYLITKRWKTNVTGDENSMRKIMKDFRGFCSNKNDRLQEFWRLYRLKINNESQI
ncbi:GATOR complex protein DEPDC5 [Sarcoptes scabiei]|uniref:DEP domain-containing protein 5 n=1 Tax=Sarcoptes scabiei TaxID=52283 RepID=A0A834VB52_SARSC|nr:GATOR complex protein DEPDC5 [Sarcoptes scabiei]